MAKQTPKPKQARASRRAPVRKQKAKPANGRAHRGQVGPQTFDQVRKLVEEKKIPVGKAFAEVAAATGRKASTVAVTYYRMAKRKGGAKLGKGGRKPGRPAGSGRGASSAAGAPRIKTVLSRVSAAIRELEDVIARQAHEIGRLRRESGLAARIRKALRE